MEQKVKEISTRIAELTLLEAASLVKALEEVLGVSAAAPMVAAAAPVAAAPAEEEKTEFDVILVSGGAPEKKINLIKEIRSITGLSLKEAKETAEGQNMILKTGLSKKDAEAIKAQLEAVGAQVKLA